MCLAVKDIKTIHMRFTVLAFEGIVQIVPDDLALKGKCIRLNNAVSFLRNIAIVYMIGRFILILELKILEVRIGFYDYLRNMV
jgi:hypothetical protein